MRSFLPIIFLVLCFIGCSKNKETTKIINGHLIEGSTGESLSNVRVTLFDDAKVYAIVFSNRSGMFSMSTPPLIKNYYYKLSFYWDNEYPEKVIRIINVPEVYDLGNIIVYDRRNPYDYKIFRGYMIHKTLDGFYTYNQAKEACQVLQDGYDDWELPETDYLDLLADEDDLAKQVAEPGWYWSSWITNGYYYGVNILTNGVATTTDPNEKLKVLPVRKITD